MGVHRGEVTGLAPLTIQVPRLTGDQQRLVEEYAVIDPPLEVGDRVWVMGIEGSRDNLAVIARRA